MNELSKRQAQKAMSWPTILPSKSILQRAAVNNSPAHEVPQIVHDVLHSPGQPLDAQTRAFMEPRFGRDFSNVRVHTDAKAAESTRAVNALAYTVGRDVVFGAGQYAPESSAGRKLMAHELTHTIQQTSGIQSVQGNPDKIIVQHSLEQEAEIASRTIVQGKSFPVAERGITQVSRQQPSAGTAHEGITQVPRQQSSAGTADEGISSAPNLTIVRQGGIANTFVSTDTISFTAQVAGGPDAGVSSGQISWTVHGVSTNSGNGNPHSAANQNSFSFRPNPTNRPTTGSRAPNDPIQYRVEAQVPGSTATFDLTQDETDIIRQEYVDFSANPPARNEIIAPAIATFNTGNYTRIVDRGLNAALTNTQAQFQALTQQAAQPAPAVAAPNAPAPPAVPPPPVPAPAIGVTSGYRNPRRNVAAGSNFPVTSRHVWGSALDLSVAGANAVLWARLRQAGANAGNTSICEQGANQIPCSDPNVDHVHIQW
jgi:hypothetical protein